MKRGTESASHWADLGLAEYTTGLLNVISLLGRLVDLESQAAPLLDRICSGPLISDATLRAQGAYFPAGHVPASPAAQQALEGFETGSIG